MTSRPTAIVVIDKIATIEDVLGVLKGLDSKLSGAGLEQFQLFNRAYYIVTDHVRAARKEQYFTDPALIEAFIVAFASHYFMAINDTHNKSPNITPPWSKLTSYAAIKSPPKFIALMLGANAHINNDLPQVLRDLMRHKKWEELIGDMRKMDKLLMQSGKEIISAFEEPNPALNFLKRHFQFMYYRPAMYTILYWRVMAWRNYIRLQKDEASLRAITNRSTRIANRLLLLARLLA